MADLRSVTSPDSQSVGYSQSGARRLHSPRSRRDLVIGRVVGSRAVPAVLADFADVAVVERTAQARSICAATSAHADEPTRRIRSPATASPPDRRVIARSSTPPGAASCDWEGMAELPCVIGGVIVPGAVYHRRMARFFSWAART
jgi:hypothetical protein